MKYLPTSENFSVSTSIKLSASKTKSNSSGFTLIELMIVIILIAILSVIGYAVYSNLGLQAKARNDTRRADLDSIAKALEINRSSTAYIALAASQFSNNVIPSDPVTSNVYCANSTASSQPADPAAWTTTCPVNYGAVGTNPPAGTSWKVCASMEAEVNPAKAAVVRCRISAQ